MRHVALGLTLVGAAIILRQLFLVPQVDEFSRAAAAALSRNEWANAGQLAAQALAIDDSDPNALVVAGIAAAKMHDDEASIAHFERFVQHSEHPAPTTRVAGCSEC